MKTKKIILAVLAVLTVSVGFSQVKFGLKAGLNIAALKGDYPSTVDNKSVIGFHGGATAEYRFLLVPISLVGEATVSTQGGVVEQYSYNLQEKQTQTLNITSINVPVLVRYHPFEKLSVEGGPQIGFVVAAKSKFKYENKLDPSLNETFTIDALSNGTFVSQGVLYNYQKAVRTVDFSMVLGLTYDISPALYVQTHYNYGLTNVDLRSTSATTVRTFNLKNSIFQFSLGYRFN